MQEIENLIEDLKKSVQQKEVELIENGNLSSHTMAYINLAKSDIEKFVYHYENRLKYSSLRDVILSNLTEIGMGIKERINKIQ